MNVQAQQQPTITINDLSVDELNIIFKGLDTLPHGQVRPLIDRLMEVAMGQLNPPAEASEQAIDAAE